MKKLVLAKDVRYTIEISTKFGIICLPMTDHQMGFLNMFKSLTGCPKIVGRAEGKRIIKTKGKDEFHSF